MGLETISAGEIKPDINKKSIDFSRLKADTHLTKDEIQIIKEAYDVDKKSLIDATQSNLKDFIIKDYGTANLQSLGFNGIIELQNKLGVTPDGSFGPDTFSALMEYQKNNGIKIDGIAGPETIAKIGINVKLNKPLKSTKTNDKPKKEKIGTEITHEKTEEISYSNRIKSISIRVKGIEDHITFINEEKRKNTGVVGGVGDAISGGIRMFGGKGYETGKQIYERQISNAKENAKKLHADIIAGFNGKNISESEKAEVKQLISRLESISGAKLTEISWAKAVFNSTGMEKVKGDGSLKDSGKIFISTVTSVAEGGYDAVSSIFEITGKAIGIGAAYISSAVSEGKMNSSVGKEISNDIEGIFSKLTLENAKKVLKMLPEALNKFINATPEEQSEGFGKFFGNLLAPVGIGSKIGKIGKLGKEVGLNTTKTGIKKVAQAKTAKEAVSGVAETAKGASQVLIGKTAETSGTFIRIAETDVPLGKGKKKSKFNESSGKGQKKGHKEGFNEAQNEAGKKRNESHEKPNEKPESENNHSKEDSKSSENSDLNAGKYESPKFEPILTEGLNDKSLYRKLSMYFHPDKSGRFSPDIKNKCENISKEINELNEQLMRGETQDIKSKARAKLELIAKDPEGYISKSQDAIKKGGKREKGPDFYSFKDGSTVESGNFDVHGNGEGKIKKPDGSKYEGYFTTGKFEKGTVTAGNGERFTFDKQRKTPLMREADAQVVSKISRGESVLGEIPKMKWTHRTTADVLEQILNSGKIGANSSRGVNFWGGLGAGYGDFSLVMKNGVEKMSAARSVSGEIVPGTDNMVYFFGKESKGNGMRMEEYSRSFGDFTDSRVRKGENPHVNDPYLMVGEEGSQFSHEVNASMIEAVIMPSHAKKYPNYKQIKSQLEARGIRIVEAQTSRSILDYAGGTILNVVGGGRNAKGAYAKEIINELKTRYPGMTLEDAAVRHLKSTGSIPIDTNLKFSEHLRNYNSVAKKDGLSRGNIAGGEFQNYASHKNHKREQQAYFEYLVESKYRNFSEMNPKELSSVLEGYIAMPELLTQKGVSIDEIKNIINDLKSVRGAIDEMARRNNKHSQVLNKLAA